MRFHDLFEPFGIAGRASVGVVLLHQLEIDILQLLLVQDGAARVNAENLVRRWIRCSWPAMEAASKF